MYLAIIRWTQYYVIQSTYSLLTRKPWKVTEWYLFDILITFSVIFQLKKWQRFILCCHCKKKKERNSIFSFTLHVKLNPIETKPEAIVSFLRNEYTQLCKFYELLLILVLYLISRYYISKTWHVYELLTRNNVTKKNRFNKHLVSQLHLKIESWWIIFFWIRFLTHTFVLVHGFYCINAAIL